MEEIEDIVKCTECKSRNLKRDDFRAEIYCEDCGLVLIDDMLEERITGRERPADPNSEQIYEPNKQGWHLGSNVGLYNRDGSVDRTRLGRSLRRASTKSLTSREKSIQRGIIQLNMLCGDAETPRTIREQTIWNYKRLYKERKMGGTSMETRCAAILYFTYKDNNINRRIDEICAFNGAHQRQVAKFSRKIATFFQRPWVLSRRDVRSDIDKYCNQLGVHKEVTAEMQKLGEFLEKMGEALCIQLGQGYTAGILYIGVKITGLRSVRTQKEISEVCGITEVTLRNNYKTILNNLNITRKQLESGDITVDGIVSGAYRNEE
tara:strand:- start:3091 stop:4050 length:960 start_codon:yes stop_codon:yes gene_type:complete